MNYKKLITGVVTSGIIATSLITASASALSTATISLAGSSNNNGNFVTTVYENTGSDTVTGANVVLDFSSSVTGVSYDYTAGAFSGTTPDGAHAAYGTTTGTQIVAVVHFTLNQPGTVTASINASSSFLKNVDLNTGAITNFPLSVGSANFTYTAPATPSQPTQSSSASKASSTSSNKPTSTTSTSSATTSSSTPKTSTGEVKGASTTSKTTSTIAVAVRPVAKTDYAKAITPTLLVLALLAALAGAYWFFSKYRFAVTIVPAAAKPKTAKPKSTSKKK